MLKLFFISLFAISFAFAQDDSPTQNNDLRGSKLLFSIQQFKKNQYSTYKLEKTLSNEYQVIQGDGSAELVSKISNSRAKKIDNKFSDEFINIKYIEASKHIKKCVGKPWLLKLRDEDFYVCNEDKKRNKVLKELVALLISTKK